MGAPNFARPQNASKYFVVLTNTETEYKQCEDCLHRHYDYEHDLKTLVNCENDCDNPEFTTETETRTPDTFDYENLKENLGDSIAENGGEALDEVLDHDRNYNKQAIGAFSEDKNFGDINAEIKLIAYIQSAYYEGATLDYQIQVYNGGEMVEIYDEGRPWEKCTIEDVVEDLFETKYGEHDYSDMNRGLRTIQAKNAVKWLEQQKEEIGKQIETIFETYTEHKLQCKGVFSNGEAIYETAN